jgi:hypothetical protein
MTITELVRSFSSLSLYIGCIPNAEDFQALSILLGVGNCIWAEKWRNKILYPCDRDTGCSGLEEGCC